MELILLEKSFVGSCDFILPIVCICNLFEFFFQRAPAEKSCWGLERWAASGERFSVQSDPNLSSVRYQSPGRSSACSLVNNM
jgi:hypothetical protein